MAQKTSALWKSLWNDQDTKRVFYFDIAGTIYGEDEIVNHSVKSALFEDFSVGNATTASLHLVLAPKNQDVEIPRGAKITRYVKLVNGNQESESIQKGVFYINRRSTDSYQLTLEAFDPMRKADNLWEPEQNMVFPMKMKTAVNILADLIGVTVDERNEINPNFTIDYPDSQTSIRDVLCWIAAANGGNFIISDEGKLYLVKLKTAPVLLSDENKNIITFGNDVSIVLQSRPDNEIVPEEYFKVGQDITIGYNNGKWLPISRVSLYVGSDQVFTAGDDSGTEITGYCEYASQDIAEYVYNSVKGFVYQMYEADDANIDLSFELGDGVSVDGMVSIIAEVDDDGSGYVSIYAPGETETVEEYPIGVQSSYTQRKTNREIAKTHSAIEKSNEEIKLFVEGEVKKAKVEINDGIKLSVSKTQSDGTSSFAEITLTVDGEAKSGRINILGDTDIDGSLVANALYAVSAYFNGVTSSKLNTNDNISRYLNKNTDGYNYLTAEDNKIKIVQTKPSSIASQAKDANGNNLYWEKSISGSTIKDGWPYDASGNRIFMTTKNTGFPVSRYISIDRDLFSISSVYDLNEPRVIVELNASEADELTRPGYLRHDGEALNVFVKSYDGDVNGVFIGFQSQYDMPNNVGISPSSKQVIVKGSPLILQGLTSTASIDFSGWDSGTFSETLTDGTVQNYSVAFDEEGRPTEISISNNSPIATLSSNSKKDDKNVINIKW